MYDTRVSDGTDDVWIRYACAAHGVVADTRCGR